MKPQSVVLKLPTDKYWVTSLAGVTKFMRNGKLVEKSFNVSKPKGAYFRFLLH